MRVLVNVTIIMLFYLLYTLGLQDNSFPLTVSGGLILGLFWNWDNGLVKKLFPLKEDKK